MLPRTTTWFMHALELGGHSMPKNRKSSARSMGCCRYVASPVKVERAAALDAIQKLSAGISASKCCWLHPASAWRVTNVLSLLVRSPDNGIATAKLEPV